MSGIVSLGLLLAAAGLMLLHWRTWRAVQRRQREAEELDYRRRQFYRRMQTSALLAVLAVTMFAGQYLPARLEVLLIYWGAVFLLVCWIVLLAVADMVASKFHFGRLRTHYLVEQAKLQAQLRRLRAGGGNGRAEPPEPRSG